MNKFRFVGKVELNALDAKVPFKREGKTKDGENYASFNCIVVPAKNNRAYCEAYGAVTDKIKSFDSDGNEISIPWNERTDEKWTKSVAFFRQYSIKLGEDKHSFISSYDFVKFLISNASLIKDKKFIVIGSLNPNEYNGKITQRFQLQNMIEIADDDNETPQLETTLDYTWTADSIDDGDWTEKKIININGYINQSINKDNKNKYILHPVVFDASKIDFGNEKHMAALNMKLKQIGLEFANGSIKNKIKKDAVCKLPFKCRLINGAEEKEFDESQLTENQQAMIACGLMSLDDFKPKGAIYGERKTTYKLFSYDLRDDYSDGYVTVKDFTPSDLASMVYTPSVSGSAPKGKAESPTQTVENTEDGVDLDSLF
jgi:hypothetical protein